MTTAPDPGKGIWGAMPPGDLAYVDEAIRVLRERLAVTEAQLRAQHERITTMEQHVARLRFGMP